MSVSININSSSWVCEKCSWLVPNYDNIIQLINPDIFTECNNCKTQITYGVQCMEGHSFCLVCAKTQLWCMPTLNENIFNIISCMKGLKYSN